MSYTRDRDEVEREVDAMFEASSSTSFSVRLRPGQGVGDALVEMMAEGACDHDWADATQLKRLLEQSEARAAEWQATAESYRIELQALRDLVAAVKAVWDNVAAPRGALFAALERLCG